MAIASDVLQLVQGALGSWPATGRFCLLAAALTELGMDWAVPVPITPDGH